MYKHIMILLIIGWFFAFRVPSEYDGTFVVGPFDTAAKCEEVREALAEELVQEAPDLEISKRCTER